MKYIASINKSDFKGKMIRKLNAIRAIIKLKREIRIRVEGNSMFPIINDGTSVIISDKKPFKIGDVVLFFYKNELLLHRLVKIKNGTYYCKGDNSFRVEDVPESMIIGVAQIDDDSHNNFEFITDSLRINQGFRKCNYNKEATMLTEEYKDYQQKYLSNHNE